MKAQQKKLSGCASNLLAHEDLGHFEEAHHWNIQAKFYNEKFPLVYESDKMREKERRGNVTILLPHLCFKVAPCSSYRESLELSLSYTSGNFHYRTWLVYSNDGLPQMP